MWEAFLRGLTHFGVFTLNEARIYLAVMDGFLKPFTSVRRLIYSFVLRVAQDAIAILDSEL
jgi:hypothetical protein